MLLIAIGNLDEEFSRLGWRYMRPTIVDQRYVHRKRRWVDVTVNAIPGYSFVGDEHESRWHDLPRGRLLRLGGITHLVHEDRIAEISASVAMRPADATVAVGDEVEVVLGPFVGFRGKATAVLKKSVTIQCTIGPITLPLTMVIRVANT